MSVGSVRRLQKEYCDILTHPLEGISAGPRLGDKVFPHWDGYIHGPVQFVTKVVHCNISRDGHISIDILGSSWSPALTIRKVLLHIRYMLDDPNPDDPMVPDLAILLKKDPEEYYRQVREATLQYATPQPDSDSDEDL